MTERSPRNCFAISLMFSLICSCSQAASDHDYIVKFTDYTTQDETATGLGEVKVVAVNTESGVGYRVDEPFRDKITMLWCDDWDFLPAGADYSDEFPVDLLESSQVRELVMEYSGDSKAETYAKSVCCIPGTGLKGLECQAYLQPKDVLKRSTPIVHFYCIYEQDGGRLIYVDGEPIRDHQTQDGRWPPYYKPSFDHDGKYLYYVMHGFAKRFNIQTHQIDTLSAGSTPIIPWNEQAVIVFSHDEKKVKLLGENNQVEATIDWEFKGYIHTAFCIDHKTFLVGTRWRYSPPGSFGIDSFEVTTLYELDFNLRKVRLLSDRLNVAGQILSAEQVE